MVASNTVQDKFQNKENRKTAWLEKVTQYKRTKFLTSVRTNLNKFNMLWPKQNSKITKRKS